MDQNSVESVTEPDVRFSQGDRVHSLERLIQQGDGGLSEARTALRQFLFASAGADSADGSIGDALALLSKQPHGQELAAIVLLRCLAVRGLLPEPNQANQIVRSTVELCEAALPEIGSFLRVEKRAQNYQAFTALSGLHGAVVKLIEPVRQNYGDLDALIAGQKNILGSLSHSIVRRYGEQFRLKDVRSTIEVIYGKLKRVARMEPSLLSDVEECRRSIEGAARDFEGAETFITEDFLRPFLTTCRSVLAAFLRGQRQRFETAIVWGRTSQELQKRYPLHEPERELQIAIPLRNVGPGLATDVRATVTSESEHVFVGSETVMLGNVSPGDFSIVVDALVLAPTANFRCLLQIDWGEIGAAARRSEIFEFDVVAQAGDIEWASLEYRTPYVTGVAKGDHFYGRADRVKRLAARLLRQPMEPFYITGQRRVGKTSLALAAAKYAESNSPAETLISHYILWGEVAHADPTISLSQLGESIEQFIFDALPNGIRPEKGNYNGSLSPLIKLATFAANVAPHRKFVVIIDEFDDIHQELFLQGNLAETFFANLRALSRADNVCIVLVGGENMPFVMDRQGQKLNNFHRENLSYFSRESEWSDFQMLVRAPTGGILNWHEDAVSEVFNITRGNPYFANIVCASVFAAAVAERDADITSAEVSRATEAAVSGLGANSFAHLWQDGIPKATSEREPDVLRRMRVLVAMARCVRRGLPITITNIAENRASPALAGTEIPAVLNDFQRREVVYEADDGYDLALPIFRWWVADVGASQLMSDALNEELANSALAEENAVLVTSRELVELADTWPTYRGRHIGTDEIRAWYQQVENPRDQRLLFELLKRTRVFSETLVRERLKSAYSMIRSVLPEFVIRKRGARRSDVVITYVDGEAKSGASYAALFAEENGIAGECVIGPGDFRARFARHVEKNGPAAAVIVMDDIAATGDSLADNVKKFLEANSDIVRDLTVRVITLVATAVAQDRLISAFAALEENVEFRACEVLTAEAYAFPEDQTVWKSSEQEQRARALTTNLGAHIYKRSPLGFGGLGLLVVFPTTVPNNSLPILHSHATTSSGEGWKPLFPRIVH
jgi:hypothetical protein